MIFPFRRIVWFVNFLVTIQGSFSQVPPKLASLPRDLEFKRGERFQLVCSCREGDPPLTFNWVKDGQPLLESLEVNIRRFDEFSSSITIGAVREDHAGNYTCIVSNLGGTDSSTVRLRVLVPPTWLRQPYDMSVLAGARVTLNCETSGTPKPTVTWRRNRGFNLQQMEPLVANHWRTGDDGSLSTTSIVKEDEGFYSCEASNGVGDGLKKNVRIEVQVPPFVWTPQALQTVKKGEPVTLMCQITGDKPLTITWTKANSPLPLGSEDRIKIEEDNAGGNTSALVIFEKTAAEDTGLYFCSARNSYGQSQATVRLRIIEKPSPPMDFRAAEVWCRSVRLNWKQSYNGNSPLKNYIVRYRKKGSSAKLTEMLVSDSLRSVVVQDLKPQTTYNFHLVAVNAVGRSEQSSEITITTRQEEPEGPPLHTHVKVKDSNGFLISWKPPPKDKWNGDLLGFYVGYKRVTHGSTESIPFTYKVIPFNSHERDPLAEIEFYISGLLESSSYTAVVRAFNKAGIGPPSEQMLIKTSYGESPQVPTVSIVSTQQSLVSMKIEAKGREKAPIIKYILHIREGSTHWLKIPLEPNKETHTIGGLNPGGNYKIYVTSRNKFGDSGPSEVITFRTESESISGSVFQYEEEDIAIPFFQRLSFIIPVAVSSTIILVVPLTACCCFRKLNSLPTTRTEGVESRGFTYTPAQTGECSTHHQPQQQQCYPSTSRAPPSNASEGHYSTLQNYGSVIPPGDPRFSQFAEEARRASMIILPAKAAVF